MPQKTHPEARTFDPKLRHVLAQHVRAQRAAQGITRLQLAERCGLSNSTLARIETASNPPDLDTLEQVALGLGVEAASLLDTTGA